MDPERYERLVDELEVIARRDPATLRRKVRMLIALGYAYIFFALAIVVCGGALLIWMIVSLHGNAIVIKLAIPILGLIVIIAKSLWITVEPPTGRVVAAGAAPLLDARVEEIRRALDAPRADVVLLTGEFNASVTQVPRLGILGWPRSYLVLGVPLMLALDSQSFDAVLGHEFAHLSGAHPKLGLWVYRMSGTWNRLLEQLERKRSWGHKLFEPFVRWYAPRMQAYGLVLSRRDEYEADADAGRITTPAAMAKALVEMEIGSRTLTERHWPELWRRAETDPEPPSQSWSRLGVSLRQAVPPATRQAWLGSALQRRGVDETHPALGERLSALGVDASRIEESPSEATESAARHYLGDLANDMLDQLDRKWHSDWAEPWRARHEAIKSQRATLEELDRREQSGETIHAHDLWTRATVLADLDAFDEAIEALRALLEAEPNDARAHFMLGQLLIERHDEAGVAHLRRTIALTSEFTIRSAAALREFFADRGREAEAREMTRLGQRHAEELRLALAERHDVLKSDTLSPVAFSPQYLEFVRGAASELERVSVVWIASKDTVHLPDYPMFVVLIEPKMWRPGSTPITDAALAKEMLDRIRVPGYTHLLVIVLGSSVKWLKKKMEKVEGARVYSRT